MNEAFGDTVSWDAIPATAIASLNLIPGSNPLFGLNALGGALSIRTKDGFSAPGSRGSFRGGSFGRYDVEAESGGQNGRLGYYLAGSLNTEDGWRDHSPSTVRRLFGDVGWRSTGSQLNVSFTGASNDLTGNGPSPEPLLAEDRAAVFTYPDRTDNDVAMAAARFLSSRSYGHVDGVAYYRYTALRTFNGDWAGDEAEGDFDAINNHSYTRSDAFGATGQISRGTPLAGRDNHFVVGAGLDSAATRFDFSAELAHLTPDRGTIGSGLFDEDDAVDLHSRTTTGSVFATNIWSATSRLARHRFGAVQLDRRPPARPDRRRPHGGSHVRPSQPCGGCHVPGDAAGQSVRELYAVLARADAGRADLRGSRRSVPAAERVRVGSAARPDRRPHVGERARAAAVAGLSWNLSAYRTAATDDIIFVSSGTLRGEGHFENVARTLRSGVETGVNYERGGRLSAFASYTLQRAVFGTDLVLASRFHPLASRCGD